MKAVRVDLDGSQQDQSTCKRCVPRNNLGLRDLDSYSVPKLHPLRLAMTTRVLDLIQRKLTTVLPRQYPKSQR